MKKWLWLSIRHIALVTGIVLAIAMSAGLVIALGWGIYKAYVAVNLPPWVPLWIAFFVLFWSLQKTLDKFDNIKTTELMAARYTIVSALLSSYMSYTILHPGG